MEAQDTAADIRWYDATQFRFLLAVDGRTVQARGFPRSNSSVLPIVDSSRRPKGMMCVSELNTYRPAKSWCLIPA